MPQPKKRDPITEGKEVLFSDFWGVYPRRVGKRFAEVAFARALSRATASEILKGAQRYKDDITRKPEYTAYPATWLNGDRWLDEEPAAFSVQEVEYLPIRFSDLPEGITFSEFLKNHASPEEREKAKRLGLKL
jgi:hypothetical protein